MSDRITQFLGDTPLRTFVKLAVVSLIVGIIMSALHFTPIEVWYALRDFIQWLYELGYEAFGRIGVYFLYGAMVVVPVFVLMRILAIGKR
ncbi:MAG: DUF6460 domain-containing protein [Rhizobiaceae bacterium]